MHIENTELQLSFVLPDRLTVRDVLRYDGAVETLVGAELYERLWAGVRALVQEWQCERIALDANLDDVTDLGAVDVIKWAGLAVFSHVQAAKAIPKN